MPASPPSPAPALPAFPPVLPAAPAHLLLRVPSSHLPPFLLPSFAPSSPNSHWSLRSTPVIGRALPLRAPQPAYPQRRGLVSPLSISLSSLPSSDTALPVFVPANLFLGSAISVLNYLMLSLSSSRSIFLVSLSPSPLRVIYIFKIRCSFKSRLRLTLFSVLKNEAWIRD